MIRLAKNTDLDRIILIANACAAKLITENIYQWNESYPNLATFERDIHQKTLFVYEKDNIILGCVVITSEMDSEYKEVKWRTPNGQNYYIHRLAVHPDSQGKGIAKKLMQFAKELSEKEEKVSLRLDTFSGNSKNQSFYESLGYISVGSIYYPKQSELPFICYELILHEK